MWCSDPLVELFKKHGYSVVRVPKADLEPLEMLTQSGKDLVRQGRLTDVMGADPENPVPTLPISRNVPLPNFSGTVTAGLGMQVGLTIFGGIMSLLGGSKDRLNAGYRGARTISFQFGKVLEDRIDLTALDSCLRRVELASRPYLVDMCSEGKLFVINAVIKSNRLSVEAKGAGGEALNLDVPRIQEAVGARVQISREGRATSRLVYSGDTSLVFGFEAVQLFCAEGRLTPYKPLPPGRRAMRGFPDGGDKAVRLLKTKSPFVRLQ